MNTGISELSRCRFDNGMLILPFYHYSIVLKESKPFLTYDKIKVSKWQYFFRLFRGLDMLSYKRADLLIYSFSIHNVKSISGYINTEVGAYCELYPDNVLLVESPGIDYIWRTKKSYKNLSFVDFYYRTASRILSSFLNRIKKKNNQDYKTFVQFDPNKFSYNQLSKDDYFISIYSFFVRRFLKRVRPQIILLEDATYGGDWAVICKIAKDLNIKVIEPQHGVTCMNIAYQESKLAKETPEYNNYLPDCLFTYGDYWNQFVTWNYEKYSVGNPYLSSYINTVNKREPQYDYLLISQAIAEEYKDYFIESLSLEFPNSKILLRLHPTEDIEKNKMKYQHYNNIFISDSDLLYEDIVNCKYVVGWYSTCLFEAIAFGKMPIIVDNFLTRNLFPLDVGYWIKNPSELKKINLESISSNIEVEKYWKKNFESSVKGYFDKYFKS